jgi:hypothetical protein
MIIICPICGIGRKESYILIIEIKYEFIKESNMTLGMVNINLYG